MVLYSTRSHSVIRFRGCETVDWLPNKRSSREVQPLAALYPTVRLSTPPSQATPPGSPQFLYWGMWASPPETDQDSCPGWLPPVPLDLVSPQESFSPGPLIPRSKRFPATRILPITLCVFSVWCPTQSIYEKTTANWTSLLMLYNIT